MKHLLSFLIFACLSLLVLAFFTSVYQLIQGRILSGLFGLALVFVLISSINKVLIGREGLKDA